MTTRGDEVKSCSSGSQARALPCQPAMGDLLLDAIGSPRHALLVATLLGIARYLFGLLATFVVFAVLTARPSA